MLFPFLKFADRPNREMARILFEFRKAPIHVRSKKVTKATPCAIEMAAMFNCWRAFSTDSPKCALAAVALNGCMKVCSYTDYRVKRVRFKENQCPGSKLTS